MAGPLQGACLRRPRRSGKLAETWANAHADTPAKDNFAGAGRTVQYREGLYVGYRYYQTAGVPVAFPFGYGLSYTSFAYSELKADARSVTLTVTNTGSRAGAEIVQVYAAKPDAQIFRPAQELKAFTKVWLEAGESKTVTLLLDDKAFQQIALAMAQNHDAPLQHQDIDMYLDRLENARPLDEKVRQMDDSQFSDFFANMGKKKGAKAEEPEE